VALGTDSPASGLSAAVLAGVASALILLGISIYVCMRYAVHFQRLLGSTGNRIAMRLFAFVIFCIGMQIFSSGLSELLGSMHLAG
jgi:multiple antibiotic resistance protein